MQMPPEAWVDLVGKRLAKAALNVAGIRELRRGDKLRLDSLYRLAVTGGLIIIQNGPYANQAGDGLRAACFWIFWFELGRGYRRLRRGEILYVPLFGWRCDDWGAIPISPIVDVNVDKDFWCEQHLSGFIATILHPFTGERFERSLERQEPLGRRSLMSPPIDWAGPRDHFLEFAHIEKPRPLRRRGF